MEIVAVLRGFFKPGFRDFPPSDFAGAGNIGIADDIRVIEMTTRSAHQERAKAMKEEYGACPTYKIVTAYFAPGATNVWTKPSWRQSRLPDNDTVALAIDSANPIILGANTVWKG